MTTIPNLNPIPAVTGDDYLITHDIATNRSGRVSAASLKSYTNSGIDAGDITYSFTNVENQLDKSTRIIPNFSALFSTGGFIGDKVYLLGHTVAGLGGGYFIAKSSTGLTADTGTVAIYGALAWVRDRKEVSVYDFGALGDGIADDTVAIQNAINHITNTTFATTWSGSTRVYTKGGGVLRFPAGRYRITKGLLVGQHIELNGDSTTGFFYPNGSGTTGAVILADFVNPDDWIISSANYNASGSMANYRAAISGAEIDSGTYNSCHGVAIKNLYCLAIAPCYGGIRLLGCPNAKMDNVGVAFTDCAYLTTSSWGCQFTNLFGLTYLYGFVAAIDVNATEISGYFDGVAGKTVNSGNRLTFLFADDFNSVVGLPDFSNKKTGVLCYYTNSINITKVASEHFEVSTMFSQTKALTLGTLYSETNTHSLMAAATTSGSVDAIFQQNTIAGPNYHFGIGANLTLSNVPALEVQVLFPEYTDVKIESSKPDDFGWKYNSGIKFLGFDEGIIKVSSSGSTSNLASSATYTTLDEALRRISLSKKRDWVVLIKDGETVENVTKRTFENKKIQFVREGSGAKPTIRFLIGSGFIRSMLFSGDCSLSFKNVDIDFTPTTSPADPLEAGALSFPQVSVCNLKVVFENCSVSLQTGWYLFQQSYRSSANISSSFVGCTISGSGAAKIMGGQAVGDARTTVINSQQTTTISASVLAFGTNGWENSAVISSNFV